MSEKVIYGKKKNCNTERLRGHFIWGFVFCFNQVSFISYFPQEIINDLGFLLLRRM